ncbi:hypothetical protein GF319_06295 [Candidatus Bathyarchaeota archaeon]|nr:hypothetical protein [Candidatus Bathyarchaeota archaeon]
MRGKNHEKIVKRLLQLIHGPPSEREPELRSEYEITIEPIIVKTEDPAENFVNHLWYTIIDQRRDVKDFVIPMMSSLMISGFNPALCIYCLSLLSKITESVLLLTQI